MKIIVEKLVKAPVEAVWLAWTTPDDIKAWNAAFDDRVLVEYRATTTPAFCYFALRTAAKVHPFSWYQALVIAGAIENQLPPHYIESLQAVPTWLDKDSDRHARNMRLAAAG